MSRVNPNELAGSMATLGLVIEQPDKTVRHIGRELDRRFTRSRFSRATAQTALERFLGPKHRWVKRCHEGEVEWTRFCGQSRALVASRCWWL
jgi:hypothetical protein